MVDFGKSDKMIKISGKEDKSNTYHVFISNISFFIHTYMYLSTPTKQEVTQCQIIRLSLTSLNSEFSFSYTKVKVHILFVFCCREIIWIHTFH